MSVLSVDGIYKRFGGIAALSNVSMDVAAGEVRAIVGKNGAGKSTLVNLLSGALQPDSGRILLDGKPTSIPSPIEAHRFGIVTVHQELTIVPGLNVGDNIMLGRWGKRGLVDAAATRRTALESLRRLGSQLDPAEPAGHLSIADWQTIEIARALTRDVRILVLDEPTSALSAAEANLLIGTVRSLATAGVAVIYVSHRLDEIRRVADLVTVLRDGETVATVPAATVSAHDLVGLMVGSDARPRSSSNQPSGARGRGAVLALSNVRVADRVHSVSLKVRRGEIVGLAGVVGAGCSETLRWLYGMTPASSGSVTVEGQPVRRTTPRAMRAAGVVLVTDDRKREGLFLDQSLADNITIGSLGRISRAGVISSALRTRMTLNAIDRFDIKTRGPDQRVNSLSGGNQQKVLLARNLAGAARVLVLDEPTRGIDVEAKLQIYELLRGLAAGGMSILVSFSEMDEFSLVCDRVIVLRAGRVAGELSGAAMSPGQIADLALEAA
jgi:ABC-type sugar transport system ATPase subunit